MLQAWCAVLMSGEVGCAIIALKVKIVFPPLLSSIRASWEFSEKATKIDEIITFDLTVCSNCQIDGEDFVKFCGLLRKHGL